MLSLQVKGRFVDNFEDLTLVVTLTEVPKLLQQFHREKVLTG